MDLLEPERLRETSGLVRSESLLEKLERRLPCFPDGVSSDWTQQREGEEGRVSAVVYFNTNITLCWFSPWFPTKFILGRVLFYLWFKHSRPCKVIV